ncbi:MAG: metallophosphoesterase [Oscillospiraceae bacterium]|nr:metallophosphoesterase [Oscillospiraceae bacterium]
MRILVVSDSHRNFFQLQKVLEKHPEANMVIHLGDGEAEFEDIQALYPGFRYAAVSGNCDFAASCPLTNLLHLEGKNVYITHGHTLGVKSSLEQLKAAARVARASIALYGHTHIAYTEYDNGLYVMNPGSVALARNGKPSYGIIDILPNGIMLNIAEV